MSRPRPKGIARRPQLPFTMRQELGLPKQNRQRTEISRRKEKRQESRKENRARPNKRQKISHTPTQEDDSDVDIGGYDDGADLAEDVSDAQSDLDSPEPVAEQPAKMKPKSRKQPLPSPSPSLSDAESNEFEEDEDDVLSRGSREYSPEVVLDESSRAFQDRQAEEDADILALEKKLGVKKRNVQREKVFEDGFDDLLEDLEDAATSKKKTKREADMWLENKRLKAITAKSHGKSKFRQEESLEDSDKSGDNFLGFDEEGHEDLNESTGDSADDFDDDDDDDDDDDEELKESQQSAKPPRENPYIAPTTNSTGAKYVPPSRREAPKGDQEVLQKLRKQAQGSLNKLSEANIISIVDDFGKLYQLYPRQDVTDITIDLVLTAFATPTALNNTYIILHAAFISALYKVHGADFGASMISKLIEFFDKYQSTPGKESLNLTSLLANLFTFNLISSTLIYDQIHALLATFGSNTTNSEESAEQLLRILRDCGPQLRSDDPTALKGIVAAMNEAAAKMTADGSKINIRTRVMMDTITDLKNNKIRHNTSSAGVTGEHLTRMRKALGSLSGRQLRGTEPLNLSRADILNSDKKGKWWLIGASWKGHATSSSAVNTTQTQQIHPVTTNTDIDIPIDTTIITPSDPTDQIDTLTLTPSNIHLLSQTHNLHTPLRHSIFTALLTAHSPRDALHRLSKLRLTRRQEPEIPRVLVMLCRAEDGFNPYYAAVARLLLRENQKQYRMGFAIVLWKFFGEIGERGSTGVGDDDDDDDDDDAELNRNRMGNGRGEVNISDLANVARFYARLVSKGCLPLDLLLKTLNIGVLGEQAGMWAEVFFIALLNSDNTNMGKERGKGNGVAAGGLTEQGIVRVFGACEGRLRKGIMWFLKRNVRRSDLFVDKGEKECVRRGIKMVEAVFEVGEGGG